MQQSTKDEICNFIERACSSSTKVFSIKNNF